MSRQLRPVLTLCLALTAIVVTGCAEISNPPQTAPHVDLKQYMGTWYEIGSFPNYFQKGCRCTAAHYILKANQQVSVTNQCFIGQDNHPQTAKAKAWVVPNSHNSKLEVQFFWPFTGDYWILYVSPHYQTALVGSPNRRYLWILARHPKILTSQQRKLLNIAKKQGYRVNSFKLTDQSCHNQP